MHGRFEEIPGITRVLEPIIEGVETDCESPFCGLSVFIASDPTAKPLDRTTPRFEPGDIAVHFVPTINLDPTPTPLVPVGLHADLMGLVELVAVDPIDLDGSGLIGDVIGEGHVLFFPTDDPKLRAMIKSGTLSIGLVNRTAQTSRAGHYAIGAIGRGRLAIGGRVRWTCASGGSGEASSCLQAALDCAAACPGGLANCTVDCFDPPVISWVPDISFLPDLVRVGPGVTIPGSWEGYTPNPEDPDPWPWPQFSGKMRIPEVTPSWGNSVVVDPGKALLDLDLPFFQVGDWAMVIEFANGEIVELKDFIEDGLDLDGSGLVGDGDGEGLSLFFHTSDPKLAARLDAGGFQVGLRNRTAGTPRQGEYAILDFGRGRVLSGIWFFGSVSWTAHCNAPGSEPVYGHAPNVLRAQIDCEAACRGSGGVLRCDIDGGPLPLPWFEDEYILPEILRVDPRELPDIKDILPVPGETPEPVDPAWGISVPKRTLPVSYFRR